MIANIQPVFQCQQMLKMDRRTHELTLLIAVELTLYKLKQQRTDGPCKSGFHGRRVLINITAVQTKSSFQSQTVPSSKTGEFHVRLSRL